MGRDSLRGLRCRFARNRRLRGRGEAKDRKETDKLHAERTQALKNKGNAAPSGPRRSDGSGMSHVTRMGPTPALTQILS